MAIESSLQQTFTNVRLLNDYFDEPVAELLFYKKLEISASTLWVFSLGRKISQKVFATNFLEYISTFGDMGTAIRIFVHK
jgi:hypothetical protein